MRPKRLPSLFLAAAVLFAGCDEKDEAPPARAPQFSGSVAGPRRSLDSPVAAGTVALPARPSPLAPPSPPNGETTAGASAELLRDAAGRASADDLEGSAYRAGAIFDNPGTLPRFSEGGSVRAPAAAPGAPAVLLSPPVRAAALDRSGPPSPRVDPPPPGTSGSWTPSIWDAAARAAASRFRDGWRTVQDAASAPVVYVLSRAGWGARAPSRGIAPDARSEHIIVHDTEGRDPTRLSDSIAEVRSIQEFHERGRGWSDIGYHYLVDGEGRPFQGRPEGELGAHTLGHNAGNIGIALLGDFDRTVPTGPQVLSLIRLATAVAVRDGMSVDDPEFLKGHRDYNDTSCPGEHLYAMLPRIRASIRRKVLEARAFGANARVDVVASLGAAGAAPAL